MDPLGGPAVSSYTSLAGGLHFLEAYLHSSRTYAYAASYVVGTRFGMYCLTYSKDILYPSSLLAMPGQKHTVLLHSMAGSVVTRKNWNCQQTSNTNLHHRKQSRIDEQTHNSFPGFHVPLSLGKRWQVEASDCDQLPS